MFIPLKKVWIFFITPLYSITGIAQANLTFRGVFLYLRGKRTRSP